MQAPVAPADLRAAKSPDDDWTEGDLLTLPDQGRGLEILDGRLLRKPVPNLNHQAVCDGLYDALRALLPAELVVRHEIYVNLGRSSRVPDLSVVRRDALPQDLRSRRMSVQPAAVVLAVEVASDSTEADDRLRKHAEYAAAGIPFYWRVLVDEPPQAWVARLAASGDAAYTTDGPTSRPSVPYAIDLAALPT